MYRLHEGNARARLQEMDPSCIDSIVTDPPYGIEFMGQAWDKNGIAFDRRLWAECLRVLKPGGHLLAFGSPRTYHRMVTAIEDAGFEIRDQIMWVFGSGFPKSADTSKALDRHAQETRNRKRVTPRPETSGTMAGHMDSRPWIEQSRLVGYHEVADDKPISPAARQWDGWGTALKPAHEPICVARKPLSKATVAANVLRHGTGALNIDGCRVPGEVPLFDQFKTESKNVYSSGVNGSRRTGETREGRWPANFIHDGSEEVLDVFAQAGESVSTPSTITNQAPTAKSKGAEKMRVRGLVGYDDQGTPARFFYCAKASASDRGVGNHHPTVKPTRLMRYLCRLVTPPDGVVLDPFLGSGSTGKAALLEGFHFVGVEINENTLTAARARILETYLKILKTSHNSTYYPME